MIYTTYFANLRKLPNNIIPIAICRGVPKWFHGLVYSKLAPSWDTVLAWKENKNETVYRKEYNKTLESLDADKVVKDLFDLAGTYTIALVCYEKPTDFCHRHLVAEWLNKNDYLCKEWKADTGKESMNV